MLNKIFKKCKKKKCHDIYDTALYIVDATEFIIFSNITKGKCFKLYFKSCFCNILYFIVQSFILILKCTSYTE